MPGDAVDAVTAESIVEEASGDLFDAPENAVLTRTVPITSAHSFGANLKTFRFLQLSRFMGRWDRKGFYDQGMTPFASPVPSFIHVGY